MLRCQPEMEKLARELAAQHDRIVRLQSVQTDIALNLPVSISLPDGEEYPYSCTRLKIRDSDQQREIYQRCLKPPPNKTVFDKDSPPYRLKAGGHLSSNRPSGSRRESSKRPANLLDRTMRCLSGKGCHESDSEDSSLSSLLSSREAVKAPAYCVVVPSRRSHRLSAFSNTAGSNLASLPTVQCVTPGTSGSQQVSGPSPEEISRSLYYAKLCENNPKKNEKKSGSAI